MPFQFIELLKQGEAKLEGFQWTSKKKKVDSWENFWNQYGMNTINAQDFWKLAGELECIAPTIYNLEPACQREAMEDFETDVSALKTLNFEVSYIRDGVSAQSSSEASSPDGEERHVDHLEIQQEKMKLGLAGEYLVLGILRKKYQGTGAIIEHTSVAKGDGLGYDILVMEEGGTVYRIEVKTTKDPYVDGFYLTPKEKKVSEQCTPTIKYQIYRVYNFDAERESASIKIYNAPLGEEKFQFSPVSWKVYEKRKE